MIRFLSVGIGRGHPFYLNGIASAVRAQGGGDRIAAEETVFKKARGEALVTWHLLKTAYRAAGASTLVGALYSRTRQRAVRDPSWMIGRLARGLDDGVSSRETLVVDHPLLARIFKNHPDVWYAHGELVAPSEALVPTSGQVIVPTREVAQSFVTAGASPDRVFVSGSCVESSLADSWNPALHARRSRLANPGSRTIGLFSSGAEPRAHVKQLAQLADRGAAAGHHLIAVAARGGRLHAAIRELAHGDAIEIRNYDTHQELDAITAEVFPRLDAFASPPHERSHWAVALGLPMLLLGPDLGSFAPLNRAYLVRREVAFEVPDPSQPGALISFVSRLGETSCLLDACAGQPDHHADGFGATAAALLQHDGA